MLEQQLAGDHMEPGFARKLARCRVHQFQRACLLIAFQIRPDQIRHEFLAERTSPLSLFKSVGGLPRLLVLKQQNAQIIQRGNGRGVELDRLPERRFAGSAVA